MVAWLALPLYGRRMGLDITAYEQINWQGPVPKDQRQLGDALDWSAVWLHDGQFMPERLDGLKPGLYTSSGEEAHFRAGSYSSYNWWRQSLCLMVHEVEPDTLWDDTQGRLDGAPFAELIIFSDAEGCIGPKTSAKLHADFVAWAERLRPLAAQHFAHGRDPEAACKRFFAKYAEWQDAFKLAAGAGCVQFH